MNARWDGGTRRRPLRLEESEPEERVVGEVRGGRSRGRGARRSSHRLCRFVGFVLRGGTVGGFKQRSGEMGLVLKETLAAVMRVDSRKPE